MSTSHPQATQIEGEAKLLAALLKNDVEWNYDLSTGNVKGWPIKPRSSLGGNPETLQRFADEFGEGKVKVDTYKDLNVKGTPTKVASIVVSADALKAFIQTTDIRFAGRDELYPELAVKDPAITAISFSPESTTNSLPSAETETGSLKWVQGRGLQK